MMAYPMYFEQHDHVFCEANMYNEIYTYRQPEYINSITSLFISWIGLFGIMNNRCATNDIYMLYWTFVINGICSCLYHYTHYIGWGLADRLTMVLMAVYCYNIFTDIFTISRISDTYIHFLRFIFISYISLLLVSAGLHNEDDFNFFFGIFLVSLIVFVRFIHHDYGKQELANKGLVYMMSAGVFWIITEGLCDKHWIMKYLLGHALWHIGVSLGGYYISVVAINLLTDYTMLEYKYGIPIAIQHKNRCCLDTISSEKTTSDDKFEV